VKQPYLRRCQLRGLSDTVFIVPTLFSLVIKDFDTPHGRAAVLCRLTDDLKDKVADLHTRVQSGKVAVADLPLDEIELLRDAQRRMISTLEASEQNSREISHLLDSLLDTAARTAK
jgi:hypothetical protein